MQVYLLRSPEYALEQFNEVVTFLQKQQGPVRFIPVGALPFSTEKTAESELVEEDDFYKQEHVCYSRPWNFKDTFPVERVVNTWDKLFEVCQQFRQQEGLAPDVFVILLTDNANEHNWFSALEPADTYNGFVHTGEWQYYIRCSGVYPVAYLIASLILQRHMFWDYAHLQENTHQWPLGCVNDFCGEKRQIILKLRTADICPDCMELLKGKLDIGVTEQLLRLFEAVRSSLLFHQNFRQNLKPSVLRITEAGDFLLPDYNKEISLYPLEKTLYLFFLNHPEGVPLTHLVDYKDELKQLYFRFTTTGELPLIQKSIQDLVNVNSGSTSQKINKISKKFRDVIGEELAKHYIIGGEKGEARKITLPRQLVINELR